MNSTDTRLNVTCPATGFNPGITGWAQINGWRGETDTIEKMQKRIEHDLDYLGNWSLSLDLKIIFLTVFKGFRGENAY
jgi:putative colanic acid biosysnthesis UDP-glucose lipid carrier transferase